MSQYFLTLFSRNDNLCKPSKTMIARLKCFWLLAASLVFSTCAFAAAPIGTLVKDFNTNNAPVWDLTGTYQITQQLIGVAGQLVDVSFSITIVVDDKGNVTGKDVTVAFIGSKGVVGGAYTVHGKVTGSDGIARLRLRVRIVGDGIVAGVATHAVINARYDAEVNFAGELNGTSKGGVSLSNLGSGKINSEFFQPVPPGIDGSWTVTMNILPLKKLDGSATATFQSGRIVLFDLSGSYSSSRNDSRISLRGVGPSRGARLKLLLDGNSNVEEARGKLLGQKVRHDFPPPD